MFDIFYISEKPFEFPDATQVTSLDEAAKLSRTRFCWVLNGNNDYSTFDFHWEPPPWEATQRHIWPSHHQANGGTALVPKDWDSNTNYHSEVIRRVRLNTPVVFIDHGDSTTSLLSAVRSKHTTRFVNDYLGTLKRVVSKFKDHSHIWVTSSLCSYVEFDLSWHPSEWQQDMLHVFPSNEQKFGDTFYINVQHFLEQVDNGLELLEWYDTICFQDIVVPRYSPPIYLHSCDSNVDAVKAALFEKVSDAASFTDPLTIFTNKMPTFELINAPTVNLWRKETRPIVPLSKGATSVIVPRDALTEITTQLYDYPYIDKSHNDLFKDKPLDIVFLSNGEGVAEDHFEHLLRQQTTNTVHRVKDITGRLEAYQEAAKQSTTDWFFVVYAKLKVNKDFDWDWQPDRMQQRKHYIFNAYNAITGDTYGHMAMIAFNKQLVLEHTGEGLDFSMAQEHDVVPILSGEAIYAEKPWDAWRTAFREVLKLNAAGDDESHARLCKWMDADDEWTAKGANDARHFYIHEAVGDPVKLRLSYEWEWLAKYYYMKYITY